MSMTKEGFMKSLDEGLKYPWGKASRLWNLLWVLLPIFGWLALGGYAKKIVRELVHGKTKELPEFGNFWTNFKEGLFVFIFMIPTFIVMGIVSAIPFLGNLAGTLISVFILPWIVVNFFVKETFDSLWEIKKAFNVVFDNVKEYLFAFLKMIVYSVIYGIACLVLVGIPALAFGSNFFIADFYRRFK